MLDTKIKLIQWIIEEKNQKKIEALEMILFENEAENPNYIKDFLGKEEYKKLLYNIEHYND